MADRVVVYRLEARDHISGLMNKVASSDQKLRSGAAKLREQWNRWGTDITKSTSKLTGVGSRLKSLTPHVDRMRTRFGVFIKSDIPSAIRGVEKLTNKVAGIGGGIGRGFKSLFSGLRTQLAGILALLTVRAGVNFLVTMKTSASNLNESLNKSRVVFGQYSKDVETFASTSANKFGIAKSKALDAAATFGNLFQGAKVPQDRIAGLSTQILSLAADLASFNNLDPTDTLDALRSGLSGESEPLKRLGVFLTETTVKQKAFQMGLARTSKEISEGDKILARHAIILEQTKNAQGDFGRTADDTANKERRLAARYEDVKARLGQALIPAYSKLLDRLHSVTDWIEANPEKIERWIDQGVKGVTAFANRIGALISQVRQWYADNREGIAEWIERLKQVSQVTDVIMTIVRWINLLPFKFIAAMDRIGDYMRKNSPLQFFIDLIDKIIPGFENRIRQAFDFISDKIFRPIANFIKSLFGIEVDVPVRVKPDYDMTGMKTAAIIANTKKYSMMAGGGSARTSTATVVPKTSRSTVPSTGTGSSIIDKPTDVTGGGIKNISINIGTLVGSLQFHTTNMKESYRSIEEEVKRVLTTVVNDSQLSM